MAGELCVGIQQESCVHHRRRDGVPVAAYVGQHGRWASLASCAENCITAYAGPFESNRYEGNTNQFRLFLISSISSGANFETDYLRNEDFLSKLHATLNSKICL